MRIYDYRIPLRAVLLMTARGRFDSVSRHLRVYKILIITLQYSSNTYYCLNTDIKCQIEKCFL